MLKTSRSPSLILTRTLSTIAADLTARWTRIARPTPLDSPSLPDAETSVFDDVSNPADQLRITVCDTEENDDAARSARELGVFLARQERWPDLLQSIEDADQSRDTSPCGQPLSSLIAFGARGDIVNAVEHALTDQQVPNDHALIDGVMALEAVRFDHGNDPYMTTLVALTHVDLAWAWRSPAGERYSSATHQQRAKVHFNRAAALLADLDGVDLDSPMIAAAKCSLFADRTAETKEVAEHFTALIDLDPDNSRHMRAFGHAMLPRWRGGPEALEQAACDTAARTKDSWGAGGYTWVYFDALLCDPSLAATLNTALFLEGIRDILQRHPDQATVNQLAAYCGLAICQKPTTSATVEAARGQIAAATSWIVQGHLHEIHPLIWAHAAVGFDNNARVTSISRFAARGRADALRCLADLFRDDINNGQIVTFTPDGITLTAR